MILPLQTFTMLLQTMAAGVQGGAAQLVDLSVGSVLRALLEACAAVALWMQWLILQVLTMTRAATSVGSDLDSWMADFGLVRLPGSASEGVVTFSRYTPNIAATVPVGATIRTTDGTQSFAVTQDAGNPAWNGAGGYTLMPSVNAISVPAVAVTPGISGNVLPGAIGLLATAITGVDTVANGAVFSGGVDAESDAALRARFQLYINSRSLATPVAIDFAIASVRQGLRYVVLENLDTAGQAAAGHFWVVVDDGTGSPPGALLGNVSAAVEAARPIGATYAVTGPSVEPISVQLTIATSNPLTKTAVLASIVASVTQWVGGLPIAGTLALSKIEALAHAADASVVSVLSASINGAANDVVASANGVLVPTSITVS